MSAYLIAISLGVGFSLMLTPMSRCLALRIGAIDYPSERRIHSVATPRFGGPGILLAIVLALLLGSLFNESIAAMVRSPSRQLVSLAIGAAMVTTIGAIDDVHPLRPAIKLCVEVLAAFVVVHGECRIEAPISGGLSFLLSVGFLVATVNALNVIDGLDGLAVGVCLIVGATLLVMCPGLSNQPEPFLMLAALCGVLLGFVPYNFHPARIFLGDSGALLLGFLLGVGAISASRKLAVADSMIAPLVALGLPVGELTLTVIRRFLREVKVRQLDGNVVRYRWFLLRRPALFSADRDHIHHRLLSLGIIHRAAVLLLYVVCAMFCVSGVVIARRPEVRTALLMAIVVASIAGVRYLGYRELMLLQSGLLLPLFGSRGLARTSIAVPYLEQVELGAPVLHRPETEQRGG